MRKVNWLLATGTVALASGTARADVSANVGMVSDYIFRGYYQEDASPFGGLDYENSGFYIGTWGADVGDGLEYDLYFGYGGGTDDFSWSVGYTGYRYTESTFDDDYDEINFGIGAGGFALDLALGEYANGSDPSIDYTYAGISYTLESGTSFLIAQTDYDGLPGEPNSDGMWFELSHGWEIAEGTEVSITFLYSPDTDEPNTTIQLSEDHPLAEHTIVFGITKSMSLGD